MPDKALSIRDRAIIPWAASMARSEGWVFRIAQAAAKACKVNLDTPWKDIPKDRRKKLLFGIQGNKLSVSWGKEGTGNHGTFGVRFEGVVVQLTRLYLETTTLRVGAPGCAKKSVEAVLRASVEAVLRDRLKLFFGG